jgi:hypothetical protein
MFVTKCACNNKKRVCNICSCRAALKHLKFIVCGSYVKQVWPPLVYTISDPKGSDTKYWSHKIMSL